MTTAAMRTFVHIDVDDGHAPSKAKAFAKSTSRKLEGVALRLPIPFVGRVLSMIPNAVCASSTHYLSQLNLTRNIYSHPPSTQTPHKT
jgi:hypothetical protein